MTDPVRDPLVRFSDRAEDYTRYRPHYSHDVVAAIHAACGLRPDHLLADIGCGTGLLAEVFLQNGNRVIGVEPNQEMRTAGEKYLARYSNFRMVEGSAECTNLEPGRFDFVIAGQAFHWFHPVETRVEFARILKPGGTGVLIWHHRNTAATPFLRAYEDFLQQFGVDYQQVAHHYVATYDSLQRFFAPNKMTLIQQRNQQHLDLDGLRGRLLSSSYIPNSGEGYEAMIRALPRLFSDHAVDGRVVLEYDTNIYYGHLDH